jgi:heme-degrading monooxygenase HmoA
MITFLNCFTVPAGRDEAFLALWTTVNTYMAPKPGYVDHSLHRSLDPASPYRFINVAHWESADAWRAAHDQGFRALLGDPAWREFTSLPGLYDSEPVHAGKRVDGNAT